jgi:type I restriction enzyme S subunit
MAEAQIPHGYKQTEVGVIPEEWAIGSLSHFWTVTDCKHVTAQFVDNGFPIASIKEVQSRFVDLTNAKQTTQQFYSLLIEGGRRPRVGDLILSRNATVGEVAQVAERHPLFAMGQDVCLLRKKSPEFSTDYLQAVFRSPIIANQLSDLMVGSTFKRVNIQQIKNFTVPMPPPSEQEAIAEALSDADALIESLEQLIAKKRHIKQGAMQELLIGNRRLSGFATKPGYKQTEVGVIPAEWEVTTVGEISDVKTGPFGSALHEKDYVNNGTPIITVEHLGESGVYHMNLPMVSDADKVRLMAYSLCQGYIVFSRVGSVDRNALIKVTENGWLFSGRLLRVRLKERDTDASYLSYHFHSEAFKQRVRDVAVGQTMASINTQILMGVKIILPPTKAEQTAIAAILSDMDAEIAALEAKLAKAHQIKQGMMQELLTGKTRLEVN